MPKQGEKYWNGNLKYQELPSIDEPNDPDRWLVQVTIRTITPKFPNGFAVRIVAEFDRVPTVALGAYRGAWDDIGRRSERIGMSPGSVKIPNTNTPAELSGTSIPNGKVDRLWTRLISGLETLQRFGKVQARRKGRSTDEDVN